MHPRGQETTNQPTNHQNTKQQNGNHSPTDAADARYELLPDAVECTVKGTDVAPVAPNLPALALIRFDGRVNICARTPRLRPCCKAFVEDADVARVRFLCRKEKREILPTAHDAHVLGRGVCQVLDEEVGAMQPCVDMSSL